MTQDGKLNIGPAHKETFRKLAKLTGKKDTDAVRQIIENVVFEAEQAGMKKLPIQMIGLKPSQAK